MTEPVSIAVVGAGNRGQTYADLAAVDGHARVVAVADPDCARRQELADRHAVTAARRFDGWGGAGRGPADRRQGRRRDSRPLLHLPVRRAEDLFALSGRPNPGTLAAAARHVGPQRLRCPRGLAGRPVRPLRLCLRQRRRRLPGRVHRIRGWRHGELHRSSTSRCRARYELAWQEEARETAVSMEDRPSGWR
jgi:hypothetical protein